MFTYLFKVWLLERFFFSFSTCHTEPTNLTAVSLIMQFWGVYSLTKIWKNKQTLVLLSLHVEKVVLFSLKRRLITQHCLNFKCQQRKPVFIRTATDCFFYIQTKLFWKKPKNKPINMFLLISFIVPSAFVRVCSCNNKCVQSLCPAYGRSDVLFVKFLLK